MQVELNQFIAGTRGNAPFGSTELGSCHTVVKKIRSQPSHTADDYVLPHPVWQKEDLDDVQVTHLAPKDNLDQAAWFCAKLIRFNFDHLTGFAFGKRDEHKWLTRIIFLESIAGVPGSVAATLRHLHSLRKLTRDHGWIHTLLEEAENERMHLMTALQLRKPGPLFRFMVFVSQGIFFNFFFPCLFGLTKILSSLGWIF